MYWGVNLDSLVRFHVLLHRIALRIALLLLRLLLGLGLFAAATQESRDCNYRGKHCISKERGGHDDDDGGMAQSGCVKKVRGVTGSLHSTGCGGYKNNNNVYNHKPTLPVRIRKTIGSVCAVTVYPQPQNIGEKYKICYVPER